MSPTERAASRGTSHRFALGRLIANRPGGALGGRSPPPARVLTVGYRAVRVNRHSVARRMVQPPYRRRNSVDKRSRTAAPDSDEEKVSPLPPTLTRFAGRA